MAAGAGMLHNSVPRGDYQVSGVECVAVPKHRAGRQDRVTDPAQEMEWVKGGLAELMGRG